MTEENTQPTQADEAKVEKTKTEKKSVEEPKTDEPTGEKKNVVVPDKFKSLVEEIEKMSVLDLAELVKILEDKFGVSAVAPVAVAASGAVAGGGASEAVEEKTSFNVELTESGGNKISVIKAIREVTELGLKDAKDLVDAAPKMIKEGVAKEEAENMKKKIEQAGGKVSLK